MTCICGHTEEQHKFNGKLCYLCSCTVYRAAGKLETTPDEAYLDRNLCAQAMVKMAMKLGYSVGIKEDPEWPVLYVDLPSGQVSWHIPRNEIVCSFPKYQGKWDGHRVEEKRDRMIKFLEATD
jgi:hypothetical protein